MSELQKQIRDHYAARSLPPEKVAAILAQGRDAAADATITRYPRGLAGDRWLFALAASVGILAAVWASWQFERIRADYAKVRPAIIEFFTDKPMYPMMSEQPDELRAWAIEQGAPPAFEIPARLRILPGKGCTILRVGGKPTYLLCFLTVDANGQPDGGMVHLVVARRRDFRDVPPPGARWIGASGEWSFVSWAQGDVIYTISTPAPVERLRSYLSALVACRSGQV